MIRERISVSGTVQGVGFRPFAFRHASALGLTGWIQNEPAGVVLELEGDAGAIDALVEALRDAPLPIAIDALVRRRIALDGSVALRIVESSSSGSRRLSTPPDRVICPTCLAETRDPGNRRHRYPFTTCTDCGPRASILRDLPFDRERTTMAAFPLCAACREEFDDPRDRRFRAETLSCAACGPRLTLRDAAGEPLATGEDAINAAVALLSEGRVLGLKGIGGFQLVALARYGTAVAEIRRRKDRPHRPLAAMFPSLAALLDVCDATNAELDALGAPMGAIVLLRCRDAGLLSLLAPGMTCIGAMLPTSPLHAILLDDLGAPIVCTSANRRGEPLPVARESDGGLADAWLDHDRAIAWPVDDPVLRFDGGIPQVLRRARGDALSFSVAGSGPTVLALGADLKNTVALVWGGDALVSPHVGDLYQAAARARALAWAEELLRIAGVPPEIVAGELHPDSPARRLAEDLEVRFGCRFQPVAHHHAHIAAVMGENHLRSPVLGFAWDGYGAGEDGGAWGGEALVCEDGRARRVATLEPFPLVGLDRAAREPRRCALGLLVAADMDLTLVADMFRADEWTVLVASANRPTLSPPTSSVGRLFDGVAALLGVRAVATFEGQAAMELEALVEEEAPPWPIPLLPDSPLRADWRPMVRELVAEKKRGAPASELSARFHASLADLAYQMAIAIGIPDVALSGGCFQNALLTRWTVARLAAAGFRVHLARRLPTNDGGIALGQAMVVRGRAV